MADDAEKPSKKRKVSKSKQVEKKETRASEESSSVKDGASFASFRLDSRLLKALQNQFDTPTLVQASAIPLAINGRDIVARAKTGSGKTLAYVVPIIHQILLKSVSRPSPSADLTFQGENESKTVALVLVPTKELAHQVTLVFNSMTTYCQQVARVINLATGSEQVQK
jgi:ATP-dependent RNA helicase DDX56/DBP9